MLLGVFLFMVFQTGSPQIGPLSRFTSVELTQFNVDVRETGNTRRYASNDQAIVTAFVDLLAMGESDRECNCASEANVRLYTTTGGVVEYELVPARGGERLGGIRFDGKRFGVEPESMRSATSLLIEGDRKSD